MVNATDQSAPGCDSSGDTIARSYAVIAIQIFLAIFVGKCFHIILRRLYMPRLISDFLVAIIICKVGFLRSSFTINLRLFFNVLGEVWFTAYLFTLGLEMDPLCVFEPPSNDPYIGYAGILSTGVITGLSYWILKNPNFGLIAENSTRVHMGLAVALATPASPLLTRLTTDLKLSKTAVGRTAVRAGIFSDMVATTLMSIGNLIFHDDSSRQAFDKKMHPYCVALVVFGFIATTLVSPLVFNWINKRNPEGRQMKGIYVIVVVAAIFGVFSMGSLSHMDFNLFGFLVGLSLPREGRISRILINNLNFFLTSFFLPLYTIHVFLSLRHSDPQLANVKADIIFNTPLFWGKLFLATAIGMIGKVSGTIISGIFYGVNWLEALVLGLLLSMKGYYHVFCAVSAVENSMITDSTFQALVYSTMLSAMTTPIVGYVIAWWARRKAKSRLMGLQFHRSGTELRVMVGFHGPHNLPMALALVDAMRMGTEPGELTVYATDMVELTERSAASLGTGDGGTDAVTVTDEEVMDMRNQIGDALEAYREESGEGVRLTRLLAISSFADMDRDICICAEDVMVVLIMVPFHKTQRMDGLFDGGHDGFRQVNQRVLQHAPCSVGIMVDRGLGHMNQTSVSVVGLDVVVVFIGGADDREALTLAARMSMHPAIRITVIRFLPDAKAQARESKRSNSFDALILSNTSQEEIQMQVDDEFFADFYKRFIMNRVVGYQEKHVADGAEMVVELRSLDAQYQLFIVGRGRDRRSVLTDGLEEWAECPELGPVGDILASSDFSMTASALIIQQYDAKKHYKVIDEEFMPF
ncbi:hypothetical protein LUZ60_006390 [Juncus effusus]|nr:hypothetical protein LUZ60_006390 [Juncus effusus]